MGALGVLAYLTEAEEDDHSLSPGAAVIAGA
jgi:hypothetical protein